MSKFEYIFSLILGFLTYITGGIDALLKCLLIFIVLDYITGLLKSVYRKRVNSKIGLKGIIKKIGYIFLIILATLFDRITNNDGFAIRTIVIYFFISNEAISIIENWIAMDLPVPNKLKEVFITLKKEGE